MKTALGPSISNGGLHILGLATAAAGILDLIWGEFEPAHQPIQAWGDNIPGQRVLAYITAFWLLAAGITFLWRRTARAGAVALGAVYFMFAVFWLPRLYNAPRVLGFRPEVYFGVAGALCSQVIVVAAAAIVYAAMKSQSSFIGPTAKITRWVFGICLIIIGLAHLTSPRGIAYMVPKWIPPGQNFWVIFTGICFVLAGLGVVSGILDVLAARLLALMLLVFSAIALLPLIFAFPHRHERMGGECLQSGGSRIGLDPRRIACQGP
jgi:uncharacterized membrane protein